MKAFWTSANFIVMINARSAKLASTVPPARHENIHMENVMKHVCTLALLVMMTGCSAPVWVKPGATQQSFDADKFDCEQKVVTMYGGYSQMGPGHAIMAGGDMKNCMRSKGYREQES